MTDTAIVVTLIGVLASAAAGLWTWLRTRKKTETEVEVAKQTALAERFDDASQLAQYIREEVERQVAPIRAELERMRRESREMEDAFRAWISAVWRWDQRGRVGDLPMPPPVILDRLHLTHFVDDWSTEPSQKKE